MGSCRIQTLVCLFAIRGLLFFFYIHICLHFPAFYIWTHLSDSLLKILLLPVFFSPVVSVGRIVLFCLFLWCRWCALDVILPHDYSFCISNLISGLGASLCFVFPADIAKMKKKTQKEIQGSVTHVTLTCVFVIIRSRA